MTKMYLLAATLVGLLGSSAFADICPKEITRDQMNSLIQDGQFTANDNNGVPREYRAKTLGDLPDKWYNIYTSWKARKTVTLAGEREEDNVVTCFYTFKGLIFSSIKKFSIQTTVE